MSDRINRIYITLNRLRRILSKLDPFQRKLGFFPQDDLPCVHRTIGFVPFFRKGTKILAILLILSDKFKVEPRYSDLALRIRISISH